MKGKKLVHIPLNGSTCVKPQAWKIRHRTRQSFHSQLLNTLMLPKVFFIYTNSVITFSWKFNKSSMWKISETKKSSYMGLWSFWGLSIVHDFEWVTSLSASGIFRNFSKTAELWQILGLSKSSNTSEDTFSVCY